MASPSGTTEKMNENYGTEPPGRESLFLPFEFQDQLYKRAEELPEPITILGPLQSGAWGIVAASPGVGKSMFISGILKAISGKWGKFGPWARSERRSSLLIDAEMTVHDLAGRYPGGTMGDWFGVCYLDLLERNEMSAFSLGSDLWQHLLMHAGDFDIIVIDNIEYTLEPADGVNIWSPETWAQVEPLTRWAKAKNKLLIFVDHLNKEGGVQGSLAKQRGASFVIHLEPEFKEGADIAFRSHFKKLRYLVDKDLKRDVLWWFQDGEWQGEAQQTVREEIIELANKGMANKDIADAVDKSTRQVRRVRQKNKHLIDS